MTEPEVLRGGNIGRVVRIGDTVRRPMGPWSPAVHDVLNHLATAGFDEAPRVLGVDHESREMLTYLPGATLGQFDSNPDWVWHDQTLIEAAELLRRYHVAISSFPRGRRVWRTGEAEPGDGEIVCHNDFGPHNTVFRDGHVAGLIDWDFAAPAPPLRDVAFSALFWVPLFSPDHAAELAGVPVDRQPERLAIFARSYGLTECKDLVPAILRRVDDLIQLIYDGATRGDPPFQRMLEEGHARTYEVTRAHIARITPDLLKVLS